MPKKKTDNKKEIFEMEDASKTTLVGDLSVEGEGKKEEPSKKVKVKKTKEKKPEHGAKYNKLATLVDKNKTYSVEDAIDLCKRTSTSKFDGSLELHLNLGLDVKAEQKVRTFATLSHGTGKKVSVMAFVGPDREKAVKEGGADFIGGDKTIEDIANGKFPINFDKIVATPDFMPKLAKVAKILGPKGLMPSPKNGTVSAEPEKAVKELKKGKLEIKTEVNAPIIHLSIGKLSFSTENLKENFAEVIKAVKEGKPAKVSGDFLGSAVFSPTMGPSVRVDLTPFK